MCKCDAISELCSIGWSLYPVPELALILNLKNVAWNHTHTDNQPDLNTLLIKGIPAQIFICGCFWCYEISVCPFILKTQNLHHQSWSVLNDFFGWYPQDQDSSYVLNSSIEILSYNRDGDGIRGGKRNKWDLLLQIICLIDVHLFIKYIGSFFTLFSDRKQLNIFQTKVLRESKMVSFEFWIEFIQENQNKYIKTRVIEAKK